MRNCQAGLMILLLLIAVAGSVSAAELTLEECVSQALTRNDRIKATEMSVAAADQEVHIAKTGFLPFLKATGSYSLSDHRDRLLVNANSFSPGVPGQDVSLATGDRDLYAVSLYVKQPLFTGGNLTHSLRRAKSQRESARLRLEVEKKLFVFKVKRAFNQAKSAEMQEKTAAKLLEAKRERLRVFRERLAEGYLQQEDVLLQETDLAFAEAQLSRCRNQSALSLSRLKLLIRQPADEALVLKGTPHKLRLVVSLDEALQTGLASREDLKNSLEQVRGADEEVAVARSAFYPQASLTGSYTRQKETNIARPEIWMLSAQLDWQLFEWGRTKAEVQRASALKQGQLYEHEELKNSARLEIEQLWRDAKDREQEIKAKEKNLKTNQYLLGRVAEKYREGTVKLADVLDAEAQVIKANNDYLIAIDDQAAGLAQLENAVSAPIAGWLEEETIYQPDLKSSALWSPSLSASARLRLPEGTTAQVKEGSRYAGASRQGIAQGTAPETTNGASIPDASPAPASVPGQAQAQLQTQERAQETVQEMAAVPVHAPVPVSPPAADQTLPVPASKAGSKPVFLQLGAFKSPGYAQRLKKDISAKAGHRRVSVVSEGGLYKVVLGGFGNREEAELWARTSGVKDYLARSTGGI